MCDDGFTADRKSFQSADSHADFLWSIPTLSIWSCCWTQVFDILVFEIFDPRIHAHTRNFIRLIPLAVYVSALLPFHIIDSNGIVRCVVFLVGDIFFSHPNFITLSFCYERLGSLGFSCHCLTQRCMEYVSLWVRVCMAKTNIKQTEKCLPAFEVCYLKFGVFRPHQSH